MARAAVRLRRDGAGVGQAMQIEGPFHAGIAAAAAALLLLLLLLLLPLPLLLSR